MILHISARTAVPDLGQVVIHTLPIEVQRKRPSHVSRHQSLVLIRKIRVGNRNPVLMMMHPVLQITLMRSSQPFS